MIRQLALNAPSSLTVQLTLAGAPAIGVAAPGVLIFFHKAGVVPGPAVPFAPPEFTWVEIDPVSMPGVYRIEINAVAVASLILDTLGELSLMIIDGVGGVFDPQWVECQVLPMFPWAHMERVLGLAQHNYEVVAATYNSQGQMLTGLLTIYRDNAKTIAIQVYNIVATYDPVTNRLVDYSVTEV